MSAHPVDMAYAVLRAVKETKEDSVSEMGVGTDILPSVFCFDEDGRVLSYAILFTPGEGRSVNVAILEAVAVMRKSWGCHAAVWAQESYTSPPTDDKRPLAERFPTDPEVRCHLLGLAQTRGESVAAGQQQVRGAPKALGQGPCVCKSAGDEPQSTC